ncbi:MAG: hypothetical protein LBK08_08035 [Treponema sp.]|jgi:hypothetical protein|nr:hypothetical protein [Treponema sp.]
MKNRMMKNRLVLAAAVFGAAVMALAMTGCSADIEYRNMPVPGATEYINYSFSYGNIHVSFTDSAWGILNASGKMGAFKTKIEELSNEAGDWASVISSYIKSKPRYEIIIADYNTNSCYAGGAFTNES